MKKILLIGMLTVAGAINLHATDMKQPAADIKQPDPQNNQAAQQAKRVAQRAAWLAKQTKADAIEKSYQAKIDGVLKQYGNHARFITGYVQGLQRDKQTLESEIKRAQDGIQRAQICK